MIEKKLFLGWRIQQRSFLGRRIQKIYSRTEDTREFPRHKIQQVICISRQEDTKDIFSNRGHKGVS
jgi:hypothetical protein